VTKSKTKNFLALAAKQTMRRINKRLLIGVKKHLRKTIPWYCYEKGDPDYICGFCVGWNKCKKEILNELERLINEPTKI